MGLSRPVPVQNLESLSKFESDDLPKILAALKTAHDAKQKATVTISFVENGGVCGINLKIEKNYK